MAKKIFSTDDFMKIYKLFKAKKWDENDYDDNVITNYSKLIGNLNEEQKELIFELSDRYLWIAHSMYEDLLISTLEKVEKEKIDSCTKIYVFPIIKTDDEEKIKSANHLLYLFGTMRVVRNVKYKNIEFVTKNKIKEIIDPKFILKDDELLFLIDDYIGTGDTLNHALESIFKNKNITPKNINIISLVAQRAAVETISNTEMSLYVSHIVAKGIDDFYPSPIKESKVETMRSIEKVIKPTKKFRFGYKESQALVTMARTPNNTFPVFWKEYTIDGEEFGAPFSRSK